MSAPVKNESNAGVKKPKSWYRRQYLVDPPVQLGVLFRAGAIALIFGAASTYVAYKWVLDMQPLFDQAQYGPMKPLEAYQLVANLLLYRLAGLSTVMVILFMVVGVYATFRVAGPIWKLQRDLRRFLDGENIGEINFRRNDEFHELAGLINRLLKGYTKK